MSDLWRPDAAELACGVANGTFSAKEVVEAHLDRISQVNPRLNAIVVPLGEPALKMADNVDARHGLVFYSRHPLPRRDLAY